MSKPTKFHAPTIINLEHGFCDPACTSPSLLAVFRLLDGTRVEFAVRNAISLVHVVKRLVHAYGFGGHVLPDARAGPTAPGARR